MKRKSLRTKRQTVISVLIVLCVLGVVGWQIGKSHSDNPTYQATTTKADQQLPVVKFEPATAFSDSTKQEILSKVAEPFVYYQERILKFDLTDVNVTSSSNMMSPDDYQFALGYYNKGSWQEMGFLFGAHQQIGYWQPQLCNDGGCTSYDETFKQKYPLNYQAYLDCQTATKAGDKDSMNLVCNP